MFFWRKKKPAQPSAPSNVPAAHDSDEFVGGDESGTQFLTGDTDLDRRTVDVLLETIARVSTSQDLESLLVDIVDHSVDLTNAERGFLILLDDQGDPQVRVARMKGCADVQEDIRFSTSIVRTVLETREPKLATVQSDSDALELGRSVFDLKLRAVMCVPLDAGGAAAGSSEAANSDSQPGVLYVDSRAASREFSRRDLGLFAALSQHISITLEKARLHLHSLEKERLEKNLELAQAIQDGLMPPVPDDVPGLEIHGWCRPAEQTSGDFFDFVKTKDGRLAAVIGDVSGHGIGPALITASAQAGLRSYLRVIPDPAEALTTLNQDLSERMDDGMFVTLLLMVFAEDGMMDLVNAGHHSVLVVRKGEVLSADGHGPALGMLPELPFEVEDSMQLESGDLLLAFTDGLIEAHDPADRESLYGEERVRDLLIREAANGTSAEGVARILAEEALAFSGGVHDDDITLLVMRKH